MILIHHTHRSGVSDGGHSNWDRRRGPGAARSPLASLRSVPQGPRDGSVPVAVAVQSAWFLCKMLKFTSKGDVSQEYKCSVRLLDDKEILQCDFQPRNKGQQLLDYVCQQLDIAEKDYFGLRYVDHRKQRKWLDPSRSVGRQIKELHAIVLCFRVKFYPPDPLRLRESTRHQIYLQLRRDLQHGRLYSPGPSQDMALLAALCLQEQLGDYDPQRHLPGYVSEIPLVLNQTERFEQLVEDFHSGKMGAIKGLSPSQSVVAFLRKAAALDTYGIDPHPVKDPRGVRLYIGTNHSGVATFLNGRRTHHFRWEDISKINYEGKMFIIHLLIAEDARTKKKHTVGFKCSSASDCRQLWRYSVEQRIFFTFSSSAEIPAVVTGGSFFSRGSKVRYCGRVERELSEDLSGYVTRNRSRNNHTTRRALSEPSRDDINEEDEEEILHHYAQGSLDRHDRSIKDRRLYSSAISTHTMEDNSSASASTKTSSQLPEGHDSYEGSSCGSGSQDDRSDVASWVALDLRQLRPLSGQIQQTMNTGNEDGGIDSDFYGYEPDPGFHPSNTGTRERVQKIYAHEKMEEKVSKGWLSRRLTAGLWIKLLLTFLISVVSLMGFCTVALVVLFESDLEVALRLRLWPEFVYIDRQLYAPLKSFFDNFFRRLKCQSDL